MDGNCEKQWGKKKRDGFSRSFARASSGYDVHYTNRTETSGDDEVVLIVGRSDHDCSVWRATRKREK